MVMLTRSDVWLAWSLCPQVGPMRLADIESRFGDVNAAWEASDLEWKELGFSEKFLQILRDYQRSRLWERQLELMKTQHVQFIPKDDTCFPQSLSRITSSPIGLFVHGKQSLRPEVWTDCPLVGVVGTRKMTAYGRQVTEWFTRELVDAGIGIISGAMYGVDESAHLTCLRAGGLTIAIWAGGIDSLFVGSRKRLAEMIIDGQGYLLSEYPLGMAPSAGTFPARNRLVAGLSAGILVTEGSESSGTLITAGYAAEFGKDVWAIPGPITSLQSAAPAQLIKSGAQMVTLPQEVIAAFGRLSGSARASSHGPEDEAANQIWRMLVQQPLSVDELKIACDFSISDLNMILSMLELDGWIERTGQQWMIRKGK